MKHLSAKIRIEFLECYGDRNRLIAKITLTKPKALNALDLDMVESMLDVMAHIRQDENIVAVLLDGEGEKAFCAGGDIVSMYHAMVEQAEPEHTPEFLKSFFTQEYRLDYCLHTFPKPVIVWGNGIIMGGGLGLFMASQIRLVTETARVAMPEISIGLFPDVGGSYFLNRLPPGVGLFLGLTASHINTQDALHIGMADAYIAQAHKADFIDLLLALPEVSKAEVVGLAQKFAHSTALEESLDPPNLTPAMDQIAQLAQAEDLSDAYKMIKELADSYAELAYFQKALSAFDRGSPITAHLVFEQLRRAKDYSLADCFRMELSMAFTCGTLGEFQEGVRALLIDKDNSPKWQHASINNVHVELIESHFTRLQQAGLSTAGSVASLSPSLAHPLRQLEADFGKNVN